MKKKMKCCVALVPLLCVALQSSAEVILKGHIRNVPRGFVNVQYSEPVLDYLTNIKTELVGDSFEIRLRLTSPTEVTIWAERSMVSVFALTEDNISIDFDLNNPQESLVTKSSHNDDNLFFNEINKANAAQRNELVNHENKSPEEVRKLVETENKRNKELRDSLYNTAPKRYKLSAELKSYALDGREYEPVAHAMMSYFMGNSMGSMKSMLKPAEGQSFTTKEEADSMLKSVQVENAALLNSRAYTGFLQNYVMYMGRQMDNKMDPEVLRNRTKEVWMDTKFSFYEQHFKNPEVRYAVLIHDIGYNCTNLSAETVAKWGSYILEKYPTGKYNDALRRIIASKRKLAAGITAPDFELEDINGKKVSLASLKGKVLYIDFWASWCLPCMYENKTVRELKPAYKGKDLLFVYITREEDKKKWKEAIEKQQLEGLHLFAGNSSVFSDYQSDGVPHYYLIDKEGKIISSSAPRPSDKDRLIPMLDEALQ